MILKIIISIIFTVNYSLLALANSTEEPQVIYPSTIEPLITKIHDKLIKVDNKCENANDSEYERIKAIIKSSNFSENYITIKNEHNSNIYINITDLKKKSSGAFDITKLLSNWKGSLFFNKDKLTEFNKILESK